MNVRRSFVQMQHRFYYPVAVTLLQPLCRGVHPRIEPVSIILTGLFSLPRAEIFRAGGKQHFHAKNSIFTDSLCADGLFDLRHAVRVRAADHGTVLGSPGRVSIGSFPLPLVVLARTADCAPRL